MPSHSIWKTKQGCQSKQSSTFAKGQLSPGQLPNPKLTFCLHPFVTEPMVSLLTFLFITTYLAFNWEVMGYHCYRYFPRTSQCPLRTLTWWRADSSSSWVSTNKEQHPLPWWLILSEWHVYSHTPLIHSSSEGRPESLSLLSVRLVVERPQVAGSSGTNHVVHTGPPSAKEPS